MMRVLCLLSLLTSVSCAAQAALRRADAEGRDLPLALAETYVAKGAYEAATPILRRLAANEPQSHKVHILWATVLRERGLLAQSANEFQRALALAPNAAEAHAGLGVLYDLLRRPRDAEHQHRLATRLAPERAAYWNNLGFSLLVGQKTDEAVQALERSLALDPGLAIAYNNLGFAYAESGDYDRARRSFATVGGGVAALQNLALAYERNGDFVTAARLRSEASQLFADKEVHR